MRPEEFLGGFVSHSEGIVWVAGSTSSNPRMVVGFAGLTRKF